MKPRAAMPDIEARALAGDLEPDDVDALIGHVKERDAEIQVLREEKRKLSEENAKMLGRLIQPADVVKDAPDPIPPSEIRAPRILPAMNVTKGKSE